MSTTESRATASHESISPVIHSCIFILLAFAWTLYSFSSGKIQSYEWYPFLIATRIGLALTALSMAAIFYKSPSWLNISRYLILCLIIQSVFAALEPSNSIEFYQYCAYFLFLAAWSFSGTLADWMYKYFPIALLALTVPLTFKDSHYFSSVGIFLFEFTTTVVMLFLSFATVISSSKRYSILLQNIELKEKLLSSEVAKKIEVQREVDLLRAKIEEDSRSRAYYKIAEHVFHDIRSPLNLVKSAVKIAEVNQEISEIIFSGIQRMESIISDLAQRGNIDTSVPTPQKTDSDKSIIEVIGSLVEEKRVLHASRTGLSISYGFSEALQSSKVQVSESELSRALSNVLNNAIESIPDSGLVKVNVRRNERFAEIVVEDNGKGIPPSVLPKLMQRGVSFGKSMGTGLGLYYAKSVLEKCGGALSLGSVEGQGTTVSLKIPIVS